MSVSVGIFAHDVLISQEITHEKNLIGCEEPAHGYVRMVELLGDRLGPLLLQLPPSYAVEVRYRSRLGSDLPALLHEPGIALALIDYPRMPRMEDATAGFVYVRGLGDRREFTSGDTHAGRDRTEDLQWWAERVDRFLLGGREIFAYANNHYQNHSPSTLEQVLEIRHRSR